MGDDNCIQHFGRNWNFVCNPHCPMRVICHAHLIPLSRSDHPNNILGKSTNYEALHYTVFSILQLLNQFQIVSSAPHSQTPTKCVVSLRTDQVSHPYKITGKIIITIFELQFYLLELVIKMNGKLSSLTTNCNFPCGQTGSGTLVSKYVNKFESMSTLSSK